MKDPSSRLLRLYLKLSEYSITLEHKPGKHNIIADSLSRLPVQINVVTRAQARNFKKLDNQENNTESSLFTPESESKWEDITDFQSVRSDQLEPNASRLDSHWEDIDEEDESHIMNFYNNKNVTFVKNTRTRKSLLKLYHDHKLGGRQGSTRTYQRLKRSYTWPNMKQDTEHYIKSCHLCQLNKSGKATKMKMMLIIPAKYPFQKIYLYIVGPLYQ